MISQWNPNINIWLTAGSYSDWQQPLWEHKLAEGKSVERKGKGKGRLLCLCVVYNALIPPPSRPLINIVGPRSKADACRWVWRCRHMPVCGSSRWCVSFQPNGDGCIVETYLECKLCPSQWHPGWVQPGYSKNKVLHL